VGKIDFVPHSAKQEQALYSDYPITVTATGIQWGKTRVGAWFIKRLMFKHNEISDNFIIVAPTYKVMEQSSLPAFMEIVQGMGSYNGGKGEFTMHGGGKVYFRTGTDPDSIVGITNVRGIWGDEAGKFPRYFWDNIEGRAAFKNCQIIITTSPYSLNWLYKDVIKPAQLGERDDVLYITARSDENPYFPKEVYEKRKTKMAPRRFSAMYGGNFERMQGLVYDCFEEENLYESAEFPVGTKFIGGIDWGYTDPFVLKVRAITPDGRHYQVSEFYKTGMGYKEIRDVCQKKCRVYGIKIIWADPSRPDYIAELNREGVPVVGARNDIILGIDLHYELIKSRRFKVLKGSSPLTLSELETYHWPEPKDLLPDQDAKKEKPVDQDNHAMDVDRYITIETFHSHEQRQPTQNKETKEKRRVAEPTVDFVKRIRRSKRESNTENWS
jgi:PBSX family phage terminase large subunit